MVCTNKKNNLEGCNCSYPCSRKGFCCECLAYHKQKGELPACYFTELQEKTYNRTIAYYMLNKQ